MQDKKFRFSVRLLGNLLFVLLLLAAVELVAIAGYVLRDRQYIPVRARLDTGMANAIAAANPRRDAENCRWIDHLVPHPWLGYALHRDPDCAAPWPNRHGLIGRDFPPQPEADAWNVLLGGGSVAMFLGQYFRGMPLYLEDALNACYVPPRGKAFRVYNGAMGGYRYPQQTIVFQLYGRAFDAFVTLEGWNEYHAALRASDWYGPPQGRFETPEVYYSQIASRRADQRIVGAIWLANAILRTAKDWWITRHSFALYFPVELAVARLERQAWEAMEAQKNEGKTTAEAMLTLPDDWNHDRVARFNLDQYKWHLVNLHTMAKAHGIRSATFLQPVPFIGKALTAEERAVVKENTLEMKPVSYRTMTDELLALRAAQGVPVFGLLDVFRERSETIYADAIHYEIEGLYPPAKYRNVEKPSGKSLGYELVSAAMARQMAEAFGFARKTECVAK